MPKEALLVVAATMMLVFLVFLLLFFSVVRVWIQGLTSGVPVSIFEIIGMRLRRSPPALIVHAAVILHHRGEKVPVAEIERCCLGFGNSQTNANDLADLVLEKRTRVPSSPQEPRSHV